MSQSDLTTGGDVIQTKNNAALTPGDITNGEDAVKRAFDSKTLLDRLGSDETILDVDFEYNNNGDFEYRVYADGRRTINIDPNDTLQIRTPSGTLKPYPLERAIVHEFGHHPTGGIGSSFSQKQAIKFENRWAKEFSHPKRYK